MDKKEALKKKAMSAAAENGMNAILFRNTIGRKVGLNMTDSQCMSLLGILGTSTPKELAHYTGLTTGSTTIMLDRLEALGYITRKPNPADRRGVLIEIDQKHWQKAAGPLVAGMQQSLQAILSSYSNEQLVAIEDFLARFSRATKEQAENIEKESTE